MLAGESLGLLGISEVVDPDAVILFAEPCQLSLGVLPGGDSDRLHGFEFSHPAGQDSQSLFVSY